MPTFEYLCGKCKHRFEVLVRSGRQKVACAKCGSRKVEKKFSVFAMNLGAEPGATPGKGGKLCGCGQDGCAPCSAGL
jgi:putative FmdB family regulatory protein